MYCWIICETVLLSLNFNNPVALSLFWTTVSRIFWWCFQCNASKKCITFFNLHFKNVFSLLKFKLKRFWMTVTWILDILFFPLYNLFRYRYSFIVITVQWRLIIKLPCCVKFKVPAFIERIFPINWHTSLNRQYRLIIWQIIKLGKIKPILGYINLKLYLVTSWNF